MKFDSEIISIDIVECKTFYKRLMGFMFKSKKINYGMLFKNCNSIHTFFMLQPIDIIMTDKENKILYMYENFKPFKIIIPKKEVYQVYELPIGSIEKIKKQ